MPVKGYPDQLFLFMGIEAFQIAEHKQLSTSLTCTAVGSSNATETIREVQDLSNYC